MSGLPMWVIDKVEGWMNIVSRGCMKDRKYESRKGGTPKIHSHCHSATYEVS